MSTFYNDIDIIGWNEGKQATENLGNLKTVGFEIESNASLRSFSPASQRTGEDITPNVYEITENRTM